jgi:hypothetical protein
MVLNRAVGAVNAQAVEWMWRMTVAIPEPARRKVSKKSRTVL